MGDWVPCSRREFLWSVPAYTKFKQSSNRIQTINRHNIGRTPEHLGQSNERNLSIFICARHTLAGSSPGYTIASYGVVSGATTSIQDSGSLTLTTGGKLEFLEHSVAPLAGRSERVLPGRHHR